MQNPCASTPRGTLNLLRLLLPLNVYDSSTASHRRSRQNEAHDATQPQPSEHPPQSPRTPQRGQALLFPGPYAWPFPPAGHWRWIPMKAIHVPRSRSSLAGAPLIPGSPRFPPPLARLLDWTNGYSYEDLHGSLESCPYRSEWPTREEAVADALKHRGANLAHVPRVQNGGVPTR